MPWQSWYHRFELERNSRIAAAGAQIGQPGRREQLRKLELQLNKIGEQPGLVRRLERLERQQQERCMIERWKSRIGEQPELVRRLEQ